MDVVTRAVRRHALVGVLVVAGACASGPRAPAPPRARPGAAVEPALPPIPLREGRLALDLVYPEEGGSVAVRDSTFVFGSTGTGRARLEINGTPVPVQPNGAFLAFLPVPPDGLYRLEATTAGGEVARLDRRVTVPPPAPALGVEMAVILPESIAPRGAWVALPGEPIEVRFRGTPGGRAVLLLPDGTRVPLVELRSSGTDAGARARRTFGTDDEGAGGAAARGAAEYVGTFTARPLTALDPSVAWPTLVPFIAPGAGGTAFVELVVAGDTARRPLPVNLALADPDRPAVGMVFDPQPYGVSGDDVVVGRPAPGFTYAYFWPDGTKVALTGEREESYRVQLVSGLEAWVAAEDVVLLEPGTPPPGSRVGTVRMTPRADAVDVRFALEDRLPFRIDEGERSIRVTLYGGVSDTDWLQYGGLDPLIEWAEWDQPRDSVYRLTLHLSHRPWGYRAFWDGDDLVVRVRRPPEIDPERPLRGLLIAVDAGHPPGGAIGPTRLREAQANLAIALRLRPMLEAAGARVLMLRSDTSAVPLVARPITATRANADVFISIHNNAFPDGVNPFENNGTSVYYFHRQSVDLARALQRELLDELRLRDLGIGRGNLAVVRNTWMPAALTETMFLMIPRQEAALRDPEVQERIARAHLRALEAFLRGRAREQP